MWEAHQKSGSVAGVSSINSCLFRKTEGIGLLQGIVCVAGSVSASQPLFAVPTVLLSTLRTTKL